MMESAMEPSGLDYYKRRVSYFFEPEVLCSYFTKRFHMAHDLVLSYNLQRHMEICHPKLADVSDFAQFHSPGYVEFLTRADSGVIDNPCNPFSDGVDPHRDGPILDYCRASAGGTISAAAKLSRQEADIAINWAGGMHRVKRDKQFGFGFVNDIVLGILELLKNFKRVLYIDIGYLHGDAVEEAFKDTDRVMSLSFHVKSESGGIKDVGEGKGKYYSLNAPLKNGLNDETFHSLFSPVVQKVMQIYQPEAVVLQSGADSLAGEPLGTFNLSIVGHGECLKLIRSYDVPIMVLGGGGLNLTNVARCWCYETAVAVGVQPKYNLPIEGCDPNYRLCRIMTNLNTPEDIAGIRDRLLLQLSQVMHVPSVQFHDTPSISQASEAAEVDMEMRPNQRILSGSPSYESDPDEDWHFLG